MGEHITSGKVGRKVQFDLHEVTRTGTIVAVIPRNMPRTAGYKEDKPIMMHQGVDVQTDDGKVYDLYNHGHNIRLLPAEVNA